MRRLLATLALVSCDAAGEVSLSDATSCSGGQPCREGASCLAGQCVRDGSLAVGDTCSHEAQCGLGLMCHGFVCKPGCTDIYHLDDCTDATWCKPFLDATVETAAGARPAGSCSPSECDPRRSDRCDDGSACVAVAVDIGACVPYCAYGFSGSGYSDTCEDGFQVDNACQPLGLNQVPVCLPAGGQGAPEPGQPGCDAIRNPCRAGDACVHVVCRRLCSAGQIQPCPPGERCVPIGERTDVAYCRAQ